MLLSKLPRSHTCAAAHHQHPKDSAAAALHCRTLLLLAAAAPRSKKTSSPSSELSYLSALLPTMRVATKSTRRVIGHEQSSDQSGPFILHWPQVFSAGTCDGSLGELTTSASPRHPARCTAGRAARALGTSTPCSAAVAGGG